MRPAPDATLFLGFLWEEGDIAYPNGSPRSAGLITGVAKRTIPPQAPITSRIDQLVGIQGLDGKITIHRGDLCQSLELLIWDHIAKAEHHQDRLDKIRSKVKI